LHAAAVGTLAGAKPFLQRLQGLGRSEERGQQPGTCYPVHYIVGIAFITLHYVTLHAPHLAPAQYRAGGSNAVVPKSANNWHRDDAYDAWLLMASMQQGE
jgi:hypothetical protein